MLVRSTSSNFLKLEFIGQAIQKLTLKNDLRIAALASKCISTIDRHIT